MRRKDKEITDKNEIEAIINNSLVCRIGLSDNNLPYIIPVCFGYKDNCLYFHSVKEGKKIDIIRKNNNICFEIDIDTELIENKSACSFSMKYRSVIGSGKAIIIDALGEKKKAFDIIMKKYSNGPSFDYKEAMLNAVLIVKIEIAEMTGKKSG